MKKPIIYQILPRLWGNDKTRPKRNGTLADNGTGKMSDINNRTLEYLKWLGCSHVWYTGIIRHSTQEETEGCIPSHPQFVKGKAGSPYAICDYYDVNPYLADKPEERMTEFEELIARTHASGLKVILDFVPNHVARDYGKNGFTPGHPILGESDDRSVHYHKENDFFYYPDQPLRLPVPSPQGMEPYQETPAMATGNNCYTPSPGINDWYETIKINYGDTYTDTWEKMYDIVDFWISKGVDGFRCDMVELVPPAFFKWLISKAKSCNPDVIFIAEVYKKELYGLYIREVGFDYLYDKSGLYDTIRAVVEKNVEDDGLPVELWQSASGITRNWQFLGDLQPAMLNFLENHDEQRSASDFFGKSASNMYAALYASLYLNTAPFMIYFGEEVGERGMDEEGFSGKDGRTTIFDWWSISSIRRLRKVIDSGEYKTLQASRLVKAGMKAEEARTFCRFAEVVRFASSDPAICEGTTYDLCYCNYASEGFDRNRHFVFLRDKDEHTLLVAANFSDREARMKISIPNHAFEWMGIPMQDGLNPDKSIDVKIPPMDGTIIQLI
ncbi:MAG: alpha-amylase [Bacteroidales bacterium]|nr:alpha-amylase [Bacteroidales bacterium]MBQ6688391.1 alpha-amylase [Bacteroidales bacterium]